jgi:uncharacterized SAM-binding protein YcdF (DUF218 family)
MKRLRVVAAILVLLLFYPACLAFQVWEQTQDDENHTADAIVVLGAAQYDGDPSPVFEARLDHAAYLFQEGFSETIIVTGGKQAGDRFTEAEAGGNYLVGRGVPEEAIVHESEGRTTFESLENVQDIAEDRSIDSILLVSDPMHSERIKRMAGDLGFEDAYASWASYQELDRSRMTKAKELVREVGAILVYEVLNR